MRGLLLGFALLLASCATPSGGAGSAPQVKYGSVYRLDGEQVHLSRFAQDRVVIDTDPEGQPVTRVAPLSYLLLIVTHSECKWSRKLVAGLESELPDLDELGVRTVCLVREKAGHPIADWSALQRGDLSILDDRNGDLYAFYVEDKTPSICVIDAWGNRRLSAEGFMEPELLVEKIRNEDFAPVPPGAG